MEFRYFQDNETLVKNRCYLSWSVYVIASPPSTLLQEDRRLSAPTISNFASSLLYPLKHYHRSNAPIFEDVPIILQLREIATVLQKQGDLHWRERQRAKTYERYTTGWIGGYTGCNLILHRRGNFSRVRGI